MAKGQSPMKRVLRGLALLLGAMGLGLAALVALYYGAPGLAVDAVRWSERRSAGLGSHTAEAAGHTLAYLDGGEGEPLVLLHGFGADKGNWVRVAGSLVPHFRVIALDLPGFGDSTRDPQAGYGYAEQVERVAAFLDRLGLREPVHLGGNSMGGGIAGLFAARYPQRVKSLWLVAPAGVATAEVSELRRLIAQGDNPMVVQDAAGFQRLLGFVFVNPPAIPRPILSALAERAVERRRFNEQVFRDLVAAPIALEDELRGSPIPTLILWGDQDRLLHVSGARILGQALSNSQVTVLANVGHLPMIESPTTAARGLLAFHQRGR